MLIAIGWVAAGLVLLVLGGEVLLRGAVGLAARARLTPAVIGLTVVAAGTSVPELAVSLTAGFRGQPDITVGNVVGSNIFNATVVVGLSALVLPLTIGGQTIRLEYPVLALVTLMCLAVTQDGEVNRLDAALFLAVYAAFTAYLVTLVREKATAAEVEQLRAEAGELSADRPPALAACLGLLAGGVALLTAGAGLTVEGATAVGRAFGMSDRLIGLTIVAVGTGLPELVTSLVSSVRGRDDVALGNVIGSNLFNILGILGLSALVSPVPVAPAIATRDNLWMLGVTLLLFPLLATRRRVGRGEGLLLVAVYAAYTCSLIFG